MLPPCSILSSWAGRSQTSPHSNTAPQNRGKRTRSPSLHSTEMLLGTAGGCVMPVKVSAPLLGLPQTPEPRGLQVPGEIKILQVSRLFSLRPAQMMVFPL